MSDSKRRLMADVEPKFVKRLDITKIEGWTSLPGDPPDAALVASVTEHGVIDPIKVEEQSTYPITTKGKNVGKVRQVKSYILVDGRRRVMAAEQAWQTNGREERRYVQALVYPEGTFYKPAAECLFHGTRSPNEYIESQAVAAMRGDEVSDENIRTLTGFRSQTVAAYLNYANLSKLLTVAWAQKQMVASVAREAAKLSPEGQAAAERICMQKGRLTGPDVKKLAQTYPLPTAGTVAKAVGVAWQDMAAELLKQLGRIVPADFPSVHASIITLSNQIAETLPAPAEKAEELAF